MVVHVTTGRIMIAALLAVVLAGVQWVLPTGEKAPAAQILGPQECADGIDNDGDATLGDPNFISIYSVDYKKSRTESVSFTTPNIQKEDTDFTDRTPELTLNPNETVVDISNDGGTFIYNAAGNTGSCLQVDYTESGSDVFLLIDDSPTKDNSGTCTMTLTIETKVYDPGCSSLTDDTEYNPVGAPPPPPPPPPPPVCPADPCNGGAGGACGPAEVCEATGVFPCVKCVPVVGGDCTGQECANGGDVAAAALNMDCSAIPNLPCVAFIPRNSCGNGEIDLLEPIEVDTGCMVSGSSGEFCTSMTALPLNGGIFDPSDVCYMGAHCAGMNGQCSWEMTPSLQACLTENSGGGEPVVLAPKGSALVAQVGGVPPPSNGVACAVDADCPGTMTCSKDASDPSKDFCWLYQNSCIKKCLVPVCENALCSMGPAVDIPTAPYFPCAATACTNGGSTTPTCVRAGCFGELCVSSDSLPPTNGQCSVTQDAACFDQAICEKTGSSCGWRQTPALLSCLVDNAASTCATDASCLTTQACSDSGGSAGTACGTDGTKVCCAGAVIPQPVEACDDGNQVDDDTCSNACEENCDTNADCSQGACVDGTCVNICAAMSGGSVVGAEIGQMYAVLSLIPTIN